MPAERQVADQHLLRGLVTGGVSFEFLNTPHFHTFCQSLRPGFVPVCPNTAVTMQLPAEYVQCRRQLMEQLHQDKFQTLVTADGWTEFAVPGVAIRPSTAGQFDPSASTSAAAAATTTCTATVFVAVEFDKFRSEVSCRAVVVVLRCCQSFV